MMVSKLSSLADTGKAVEIASLLHDIGKPASRRINPRNSFVNFAHHSSVGAFISIPILEEMISDGILVEKDAKRVFELIALHTLLHTDRSREELLKMFSHDMNLFEDLVTLNKYDALGSFSTMHTWDKNIESELYGLCRDGDGQSSHEEKRGYPHLRVVLGVDSLAMGVVSAKYGNRVLFTSYRDVLDEIVTSLKNGEDIVLVDDSIGRASKYIDEIEIECTKTAIVVTSVGEVEKKIYPSGEFMKKMRNYRHPLGDRYDRIDIEWIGARLS
jgi:hypothetical protein